MPTQLSRLWFPLLAATFFFLPLNTLRLKGVAIADFLVLIVLCAGAATLVINNLWRLAIPKWLIAAAAILIFSGIVTSIIHPTIDPLKAVRLIMMSDPYSSSAVTEARLLLALMAFPIAISLLVQSWRDLNWIATFWVLGVALSCLVALSDAAFGTGIQLWAAADPAGAAGWMGTRFGQAIRHLGLSDHPNTLGITAAMAAPVAFFRLWTERDFRLFAPLLALLFCGVVLSGSRAAALGFIVAAGGSLVLLWRSEETRPKLSLRRIAGSVRRWRPLTYVSAALVVVIVLSLVSTAVDINLGGSDDGGGDGSKGKGAAERLLDPTGDQTTESNHVRMDILKASLRVVADAPITGIGFRWIETPHNLIVALLLSGGVIALFGFGVAIVGYVREGFRAREKIRGEDAATIGAALVSIAVLLLSEMFNNHTFNRYLYIPMGMIMAGRLLLALSTPERTSDSAP